jgi:hypothetical protein
MRRELIIGATALSLFTGSQAWAQAVIEFAPEQRVKIKEYVVRQKVKPLTVREQLVVGGTIPADAELYTVPSDWGPGVSSYRYVYSGNRVVFVEPSTRKVIQILE